MRNSSRLGIEIPVTFQVGKNTFSGTTANLSDGGMLIESSFARENARKVMRNLLKTRGCPVRVSYAAEGRLFTRNGIIKHYHLDFGGVNRFTASPLACGFQS